MASQSRVNIDHLADFGQKTAGFGISGGDHNTMTNFTEGSGKPDGKMMKAAVAGTGLRTNEAKVFNDYYNQAVIEPTKSFLQDVPKGFMALGGGAVVMAANYNQGDQNQAGAMHDVIKMFTQDPSKGLDADLAKQQNAHDRKKVTVKPLPAPDTPDDAPPMCTVEGTPSEKATRLYNKYKDDIHWPHPPDDNDDPDTKILAPGPLGQQPDGSSSSGTTVV